jgi:hypothetical protein
MAVIAAVAGLAFLLERNAYPSYDYAFALSAAQDVLHGRTTGYDVALYSPVPHPLTLALSLATVPLSGVTIGVFTAVALLAFGLLCVAVFRTGALLGGWPVGALSAVLVFTSPAIFELGVRTYGDVWFAALVVFALALELERPRRGWPVLCVLSLAGLLRPEAWALAAAYWLYLFPRRAWRERLALAALVAAAPVAWSAMDVALTGDALHSIQHTQTYTEHAHRTLTADSLWTAMTALTTPWVLVGALAGAVLAVWRDRRRGILVLAVAIGAFALTVAPAVFGQTPVLRRYLLVPGSLVPVLFAFACLGWAGRRRLPRAWTAGGLALLALAVGVSVDSRIDNWHADRQAQRYRVDALHGLHDWVASGTARAYLRDPACHPVRTPGYSFRPYLRLWLDIPPRAVSFDKADFAPNGPLLLLPTAAAGYERTMLRSLGERSRAAITARADFRREYRLVAASARWELYADGTCRSGHL